ncbi:MAG: hypothetical protein HRT73_09980, partial [Flavobacteriales bacterium]|nr:hypothetical protein [Flavobacteriales bacterium]
MVSQIYENYVISSQKLFSIFTIMDFRALLEQGHSKSNTTIIVNEVCVSTQKMEELMQCFIDGPVQITQRA